MTYTLTIDQIRKIVFETSVVYGDALRVGSVQQAEWERHAQMVRTLKELQA